MFAHLAPKCGKLWPLEVQCQEILDAIIHEPGRIR